MEREAAAAGMLSQMEPEEPKELGPARPAWVHNHRQRPDGLFLEGEDNQVQGAYSWCSQKEKVLRDVARLPVERAHYRLEDVLPLWRRPGSITEK